MINASKIMPQVSAGQPVDRSSMNRSQSTAMTTTSDPASTPRCQEVNSTNFSKMFSSSNPSKVDENNMLSHSAFHAAFQMITDKMQTVPFYVKRHWKDGIYQPDCSHQQHDLIHNVACGREDGDMKSIGWVRKLLTGEAIIHGNGIGYINRNRFGVAQELVPLPSSKVFLWYEELQEPIRLDNGRIKKSQKFYCILTGGGLVKLRPENVYHIQNLALGGGDWSPSLCDYVQDALGIGIAAARSNVKFFANGMQVNGILMIPGHLSFSSDEEKQEIINKFRDAYESSENAGKTLVLEEGWKFMQTSASNDQSQLVQLRQLSSGDAGLYTRIPGGLIGGAEPYAYNTQEQLRGRLREQALDYWWNQHSEQSNLKLLPTEDHRSGNYRVEPDPDDGLLMPAAEKYTVFGGLHRDNSITRAELRNKFNLPVCESDDVYFDGSRRKDCLPCDTDPPATKPEQEPETDDRAELLEPTVLLVQNALWTGTKKIVCELRESSASLKKLYKFADRQESLVLTYENHTHAARELYRMLAGESLNHMELINGLFDQVDELLTTVPAAEYQKEMVTEIIEQFTKDFVYEKAGLKDGQESKN